MNQKVSRLPFKQQPMNVEKSSLHILHGPAMALTKYCPGVLQPAVRDTLSAVTRWLGGTVGTALLMSSSLLAAEPEARLWDPHATEAYATEAYGPEAYGPEAYGPEAYGPEAYVGASTITLDDVETETIGSALRGDTDATIAGTPVPTLECRDCDYYHWEFLPRETLYPFYLADPKASRMAGTLMGASNDNTLLDGTLGGRFGIVRYVNDTRGPFRRGMQLDFEGAAQVRLDLGNDHDVRSVDFRAGIPLSFSFGRFQTRMGYYHLSSHVGDEFLLRNPGFNRLNYSRDVLFLGGAYWLDEATRIYGEAGWAFYSDVSQPWEFVFGIEEAPRFATGIHGAPFYAVNVRLREEVDFGGGLTAQIGWAWRSGFDTGLLRVGFHYFNGKSNQFSFYNDHEQQYGLGLWYDF